MLKLESDVELAARTTLGVGGKAAHYARIENDTELRQALAWAAERRLPVRVLGGGSNLVIADSGFAGLVIEMAMRGCSFSTDGNRGFVRVRAGEPWDEFVLAAVERGYQGLECLSGIPGSVGATPIQNVGAYGQDVSETIASVLTFDTEAECERRFSKADCHFSYRSSFFKSLPVTRYIVTEVTFELRAGAKPELRYAELERHFGEQGKRHPSVLDVRQAVLQLRRAKSMVLDAHDPNTRSCGSFFLNPVLTAAEFGVFEGRAVTEGKIPQFPQRDGRIKLAAAWLIEHAGFTRGMRDGSVGLSTQHALALVAYEGARAADVLRFAERVQREVAARFGVQLEREPVLWGDQPTL